MAKKMWSEWEIKCPKCKSDEFKFCNGSGEDYGDEGYDYVVCMDCKNEFEAHWMSEYKEYTHTCPQCEGENLEFDCDASEDYSSEGVDVLVCEDCGGEVENSWETMYYKYKNIKKENRLGDSAETF